MISQGHKQGVEIFILARTILYHSQNIKARVLINLGSSY